MHILSTIASAVSAAEVQTAEPGEAWVAAMQVVHDKFYGERGTFAQFGDSITFSRALWYGLKYAPRNASPEMTRALGVVNEYMLEDCFSFDGCPALAWSEQFSPVSALVASQAAKRCPLIFPAFL